MGGASIRQMVGNVELNTDDTMRLEYSAPRRLHEETNDDNALMLLSEAYVPLDAFGSLAALGPVATSP